MLAPSRPRHALYRFHAIGRAVLRDCPVDLRRRNGIPRTQTAMQIHASNRRTDYLEGIRGLAALYVAINHVVSHYYGGRVFDATLPWWTGEVRYLMFGRLSVAAFIVLSGYLLTRPIALRQELSLSFWPFMRRRLRRIGPPYWAALILSLIAIEFIPALQSPSTPMWSASVPYTHGGVVSHLLMIHNLRPHWIYQINPPLWSVSTEFQIYLFMPLVLVPVWRRWGITTAAVIGVLLGLSPCFVLDAEQLRASPWFLSLFAFGMLASVINFSPAAKMRAIERDGRWPHVVWITGLAVLSVLVYEKERRIELPWVMVETVFGIWMAFFLVWLSRSLVEPGSVPALIVRILAWKPLVWIGSFSYSIYLIHQPVMSFIASLYSDNSVSRQMLYTLIVGFAVTVPLAYLFHRAFERPFMRGRAVQAGASA